MGSLPTPSVVARGGAVSSILNHTHTAHLLREKQGKGGESQGRGGLGHHMVSGPRYCSTEAVLHLPKGRGSPRVERESIPEVFI